MSRLAVLLAVLAAAAGASGCGLGAGSGAGSVSLVVTRDFGRVPVKGSPVTAGAPGGETAMRALERSFDVRTRYGGGFVQAIDGVSGGSKGARPLDWFFYVNGIEAPKGAASTRVHNGDVIWWDHHDWGATHRVPAVVGAFPEPFRHGADGRRLPARVDCAPSSSGACAAVARQLAASGVIAGQATLDTRSGPDLLRVLVGTWSDLRSDFAARLLERGPSASGVYARPAPDGRSIALLDARGRVTRTLGAGSGLIAATADGDAPPTWIVTGVDARGVARAADHLAPDVLRDRFAVALGPDPVALPDTGGAR